jgi:very-short-patch-repair endonuclease
MDLGAVARDQAGVFIPAQARACGLSTYQIRRRRAVGEFVPALGSALAFAGAPIVAESLDWAAYLSAGSYAVMSGASAAARHRIKIVGPRPCVTVPARRHLQLDGVRLLRDDLPDVDVDFVASAAVTSLPRTVVDCLALARDREALALLDRALQRYWITLETLVAYVRSRTGTKGAERLRRFVRIAASGARSDSERLLVRCCARAGLSGWEVNATVVDAEGRPIGEFDVVIEHLRLAIEADGWAYHSDQGRFQHDRTKQNAVVRAGWTVLRFTWWDLQHGADDVIQTIRTTAARLQARRIP